MNAHCMVILGWLLAAGSTIGFAQDVKHGRGMKRGQPAPPAAMLLVGINDVVGGIAEPGWPLIVGATRKPDAAPTASLPLPSTLRVQVTNARGEAVPLNFEPVPQPATTVGPVVLHWIAAETTTTQLAPGTYLVTLISTPAELTGWRIEAGDFQVVVPSPDRRGETIHLNVQRAVLLGRDDDALVEAERLTATLANDPNSWITKGDILMRKDKPDEALAAFDQALRLHKKDEREPLAIMTRRRAAQLRSLEKRGVVAPQQPKP